MTNKLLTKKERDKLLDFFHEVTIDKKRNMGEILQIMEEIKEECDDFPNWLGD